MKRGIGGAGALILATSVFFALSASDPENFARLDANVLAICETVGAVCDDGSVVTTTTVPTTSTTAPTTTTAPVTTTTALAQVSVSVTWNGSVAHVDVVPNHGAVVVVRGPNGVVVSRGATGDIPTSACCSTPGTYTWTVEPNTGFTAVPGNGQFVVGTPPTSTTTTTMVGPTTTTTVAPTTTTTVPQQGASYVNPINTGFRGNQSDLTAYSGPLTITSNTTIEGMIVRGEVRVCGNVTVTFRDVLWQPTSTNAGGRAFQVDGSNGGGCTGTSPTLILDHVTIDGNGQTQRGASSQRGGVVQVHFADISGVEDCMNSQGGSASRRNILQNSYCHDLDSPASSPHHDGIQVMGGHALIQWNVILVPNSATAAVFLKSDAGAITATVDRNYLNGGTFTARRCEGTVTATWTNNEIGPDHQFGAILGPVGGCTATVSGDIQVTYRPGQPGFHPGNQT